MNVIREVRDDVQMLYTKKDVIELLIKQRDSDVEKACGWLCHNLIDYDYCGMVNGHHFTKSWIVELLKQNIKCDEDKH